MKKTELEKKLTALLNSESREDDSNTPDFILSELMVNCLDAFELVSNKREVWFGVELDILNNWDELITKALGEASMCWSDVDGAGTFDAEKAKEISKKLLQDIKAKPIEE